MNNIEWHKYCQDYEGLCGTCHYCTQEDEGYSCMCLDSPFAADWIELDDECNCYAERRIRI